MEQTYHNECEHCKELFWTKDAWQSFCENCSHIDHSIDYNDL